MSGYEIYLFSDFYLDFCHRILFEFFLQLLIRFLGGKFQLNSLFLGDFTVSDHLIDTLFNTGSTAADIGNLKNGADSSGDLFLL